MIAIMVAIVIIKPACPNIALLFVGRCRREERVLVAVPFSAASGFSVWPFGWPHSYPPVSECDNQGIVHTTQHSGFKNGGREDHFLRNRFRRHSNPQQRAAAIFPLTFFNLVHLRDSD